VRYAQVIVNLENRRAVEVPAHRFLPVPRAQGTQAQPQTLREIIAALPGAAFGWLQLSSHRRVVSCGAQVREASLDQLNTWKPTQDDLSKLRSLVNRKAGREIM